MSGGEIKTNSNEYVAIHEWIRYHYGSAQECEKCNKLNLKRYDWALKKGFCYAKNINNFIQLCRSCHKKYDYHCVGIEKYDKSGVLLNKYPSVSDAAIQNKILPTSIINALNGSSRTSGGFVWKYITPKTKMNTLKLNVTNAKIIAVNGVSKNMSEWSIHLGGRPNLVFCRIKRGWTIKKAVTIPYKSIKVYK